MNTCPKCKSSETITGTQGFGVGKAAIGAVAAGPIGLVAGAINKNKTANRCGSCGHTWNPAKSHAKAQEKARYDSLSPGDKNFEALMGLVVIVVFIGFAVSVFN